MNSQTVFYVENKIWNTTISVTKYRTLTISKSTSETYFGSFRTPKHFYIVKAIEKTWGAQLNNQFNIHLNIFYQCFYDTVTQCLVCFDSNKGMENKKERETKEGDRDTLTWFLRD